MRLVLTTWNVHGWVGDDGRRDPRRCFEAIGSFGADVVALQEVEGSDWVALAESHGYRAVMGQTGAAAFGNALLLRLPLVELRTLDLSVPGRERRGALDALLEPPGARLRVVATHLGLRVRERRRQAARLAAHIESRDADLPTALVGDLNDWTPWGSQLGPLARAVGPLSRIPTFPSRRPLLPLDRGAFRAPGRACRMAAIRSPGVRRASDHLPLRLELDLADV